VTLSLALAKREWKRGKVIGSWLSGGECHAVSALPTLIVILMLQPPVSAKLRDYTLIIASLQLVISRCE
jgi:hypothetical protein